VVADLEVLKQDSPENKILYAVNEILYAENDFLDAVNDFRDPVNDFLSSENACPGAGVRVRRMSGGVTGAASDPQPPVAVLRPGAHSHIRFADMLP
jgi:hypothetical protein